MAINLQCDNHHCKYYFEMMCQRNVNEESLHISKYGRCETYKPGKSDWYKGLYCSAGGAEESEDKNEL